MRPASLPVGGQAKSDVRLVSIQRLLRRGAITNLAKMLARMHPADIANVVDHLSSLKEKREIFELVRGDVKRGQVLSELNGDSITLVLSDMLPSDAAWLLKDLGSDDIAYILSVIPNDRAKDILALMRTEDSTEIADLLKYPKGTAGGIMTTEFFALSEDATAQEAIRRLQQATDAEMVFYIYVTDKEDRLVGVLSLRQLLTVPPATPLKNIMTRDLISVAVDMDQEEVSRQVASYNLAGYSGGGERRETRRHHYRGRRGGRYSRRGDRRHAEDGRGHRRRFDVQVVEHCRRASATALVVHESRGKPVVRHALVDVSVHDSGSGRHRQFYPCHRCDGWQRRAAVIHADHSRARHGDWWNSQTSGRFSFAKSKLRF